MEQQTQMADVHVIGIHFNEQTENDIRGMIDSIKRENSSFSRSCHFLLVGHDDPSEQFMLYEKVWKKLKPEIATNMDDWWILFADDDDETLPARVRDHAELVRRCSTELRGLNGVFFMSHYRVKESGERYEKKMELSAEYWLLCLRASIVNSFFTVKTQWTLANRFADLHLVTFAKNKPGIAGHPGWAHYTYYESPHGMSVDVSEDIRIANSIVEDEDFAKLFQKVRIPASVCEHILANVNRCIDLTLATGNTGYLIKTLEGIPREAQPILSRVYWKLLESIVTERGSELGSEIVSSLRIQMLREGNQDARD